MDESHILEDGEPRPLLASFVFNAVLFDEGFSAVVDADLLAQTCDD